MSKSRLPFLVLITLLTITAISCRKGSEDKYAADSIDAWFPLEKGHYIIYDVDSTIWDDFNKVMIEKHYQIRYTVTDTFTDAQGRISHRIETYIRTRPIDAWKHHNVQYVTNTYGALEQVYNNQRFIKLIFPIVDGSHWDGNAYIPDADQDLQYFTNWDYRYTNTDQAYNNGKLNFARTVTVEQVDERLNDPESLPLAYATRTYSKEMYAFGVGMIQREMIYWTYDPNTSKYRNGKGVVMKAVEYN